MSIFCVPHSAPVVFVEDTFFRGGSQDIGFCRSAAFRLLLPSDDEVKFAGVGCEIQHRTWTARTDFGITGWGWKLSGLEPLHGRHLGHVLGRHRGCDERPALLSPPVASLWSLNKNSILAESGISDRNHKRICLLHGPNLSPAWAEFVSCMGRICPL